MAGAGQVGAALALYAKAKKNLVTCAGKRGDHSGSLGIGEPLIYGVTLPRVKPLLLLVWVALLVASLLDSSRIWDYQ